MAREFSRSERIASQIQKEIAVILQFGKLTPNLGFVTVNDVEVSKDCTVAKVFVTVLNANNETKKESVAELNKVSPQLRHQVAKAMRIRSIPELRFYYDDAIDQGIAINNLLHQLKDDTPEDKSE